ncbi:MAG: hypothetical protein HW400_966 [Candidatus Levybacteria bacterium]|nr:hypothetical protein [Candidatus Levybacteria bacterium]
METLKHLPDIRKYNYRGAVEQEFINPSLNTICVEESKCNTGTIDNNFVSRGFYKCSGFALKSKNADIFGFFHAWPSQELYQEELGKLEPLMNGEVILIEGSASTIKSNILHNFLTRLKIRSVGTIHVETLLDKKRGYNTTFDVLFTPKENQISVLRKEKYDNLLIFSAF